MSQSETSLTTGITTAGNGIECGRGTIEEQSVLTSENGGGLPVKPGSDTKADLPSTYNRKAQQFLPIEKCVVFMNSQCAMGGGVYQHSGRFQGEHAKGRILQRSMEPRAKGADSNDNVASISSEDLPRSFENSRPFILRAEQFESIGKCNLTAVPISNSSLLNLNNNQSESRENTIVTVTVDPHGILMPTSQENNNEITSVMSLSNPSAPITSNYRSMSYSDEKSKEGVATMLSELYDCCWLNCDEKFFSQDNLVIHVNHQHVRVQRPDVDYQCKWDGCQRRGRGFNARYKMLIHIRTHTNEKPHNCSLCGKSFSRLENLKIHNRSHTGEKPYICPFVGCNKAYSNSSDRFKHVRTHQEEKPYICKLPGCNKRYTDPSSLRKHVRTHGHYLYDTADSSKIKQDSSQSISILTLPANVMTNPAICRDGLTNQANCRDGLTNPLLSFQNNIMHTPGLMSNPLLSSTIINSPITTQTTATQTDKLSVSLAVSPESPTHKVDLGQDGSILETEGKCQDSPLDLSTSPVSLPGNSEVCTEDSVSSSYSSKWDLIHSD